MSEPTRDFDVDDAFAYVILRTHRLLRWRFHRAMRRAGLALSQEQFVMLNKLSRRSGCTQGELVSATFNDRANVSRIVASLERNGYVTRSPDQEDRRVLRVGLTSAGQELLNEIGAAVPRARELIYRGLGPEDLDELKRICGILEENVLREMGKN